MSATNVHTESVHASTVAESVDTNGDGDAEVTLSDLRSVESAADVSASASGGYVVSVQSVSGNTVTIRVFEDAGAAGELAAVTGSAGVTDLHVSALGY